MELITGILIVITVLFFLLLAIKNLFNVKKLCAICLSVTIGWIALLVLYFFQIFSDKIIIAILMGHTSLGIYYLLEKKVNKRFLLFRLPYLLTSISIIYFILEGFNLNTLILLAVIWLFFAPIYLFKFNKLAKKIIECCKKW